MGRADDSLIEGAETPQPVAELADESFPSFGTPGRMGDIDLLAILAIVLLAIARAGFLAAAGLELAPDEAYYWDWSRHLDWGYCSKPPLVAWSIAASTSVFGPTEWGVRFPAILYGAVGLVGVFSLANAMYGRQAAWLALLLVIAVPGVSVTNYVMTIDSPLLATWAWALYGLWLLARRDESRGFWISLVATGIGLLAKQTMLTVFPLMLLFLACSWRLGYRWRGQLVALRWRTVIAWMVGSLLFLTPVIWWNSQHEWATFEHTQHHFAIEDSFSMLKQLVFGLEFLGGMLGLLSPVLGVVMLVVLARISIRFRSIGDREIFLLVFSALPLAGVMALSFIKRVHPNWPAPYFLAAAVLVAGWATGKIAPMQPTKSQRRWLTGGVVSGLLCVIAMHSAILILPHLHDQALMVSRLTGWKKLARTIEQQGSSELPLVAISERGPVSELAFYLTGQPRVSYWTGRRQIETQHDVWGLPPVPTDMLVLVQHPTQIPPQWTKSNADIRLVMQITGRPRIGLYQYSLWRVRGLTEWPMYDSAENAASNLAPDGPVAELPVSDRSKR